MGASITSRVRSGGQPVYADVAEKLIFHRIPFRATRRIMTHGDRQTESIIPGLADSFSRPGDYSLSLIGSSSTTSIRPRAFLDHAKLGLLVGLCAPLMANSSQFPEVTILRGLDVAVDLPKLAPASRGLADT
jgi:hypothetical protein